MKAWDEWGLWGRAWARGAIGVLGAPPPPPHVLGVGDAAGQVDDLEVRDCRRKVLDEVTFACEACVMAP